MDKDLVEICVPILLFIDNTIHVIHTPPETYSNRPYFSAYYHKLTLTF